MRFKRRLGRAIYFNQINTISFLNVLLLFFSFLMLGTGFAVVPGLNVKLPDMVTSKEFVKIVDIRISEDDTIYLQGNPAFIKDVATFLKKNKYETVFIKADKNSNVGVLTEVWQACKDAGIGKISFVTNM
ncbi:MAG: biopolymer transporter ExbD [Candidatus Omnitrophica bacterium]|nr:biopolymer transporter ExbD [Candidatus Omnitrophota bacterium]